MVKNIKKMFSIFFLSLLISTQNTNLLAGLSDGIAQLTKSTVEGTTQLLIHPMEFFTAQKNYFLAPSTDVIKKAATQELMHIDNIISTIDAQNTALDTAIQGSRGWMPWNWIKFGGLNTDPNNKATIDLLEKAKLCLTQFKENLTSQKNFLKSKVDPQKIQWFSNNYETIHNKIATHGVQTPTDIQYLNTLTELKKTSASEFEQQIKSLASQAQTNHIKSVQIALNEHLQDAKNFGNNWESTKFNIRQWLETTFANPYLKWGTIGLCGTYGTYKFLQFTQFMYRWRKGITNYNINNDIRNLLQSPNLINNNKALKLLALQKYYKTWKALVPYYGWKLEDDISDILAVPSAPPLPIELH